MKQGAQRKLEEARQMVAAIKEEAEEEKAEEVKQARQTVLWKFVAGKGKDEPLVTDPSLFKAACGRKRKPQTLEEATREAKRSKAEDGLVSALVVHSEALDELEKARKEASSLHQRQSKKEERLTKLGTAETRGRKAKWSNKALVLVLFITCLVFFALQIPPLKKNSPLSRARWVTSLIPGKPAPGREGMPIPPEHVLLPIEDLLFPELICKRNNLFAASPL